MAFHSPEPATRRDGEKLNNWGRGCIGKPQKPVSCTHALHIELGKLYAVGDFAGATQVFQAEVGPEHGV